MATHDYVIANGTGAAVRSDLNDALAAIVSNNSGSSEPATTYAYQWWADTTANVLKIRNSANNAWITLRELDGTMLIEDGSAASPGLAFADDTNTGIFSGAADQVGFATGGAERLKLGNGEAVFNDISADTDFRVESNGNTHMLFVDAGNDRVGIGASAPDQTLHIVGNYKGVNSSGQGVQIINTTTPYIQSLGTSTVNDLMVSSKTFRVETGTSYSTNERARIDSSGRLLLGTSTARANFFNGSVSAAIQNEGAASSGTPASRITAQIFGKNDADDPLHVFAKHRGTSVGANTIVADDDFLGGISFQGSDGSEFVQAAEIRAAVDGTPGSNSMPGRLIFSTTASGASSPTERMRILSTGSVLFSTDTEASITGATANGHSWSEGNQAWASSRNVTSGASHFLFYNPNGLAGNIETNGSTTSYNTSSDYRLKENVIDIADGIDRVKQLQPRRFNFIADADTTVDGFLAHEAQAVVPEAVTGTHNEVDDDGNAVMQGIDQSKLVPLLTAALKEAIAKIETLETKVAALEAG